MSLLESCLGIAVVSAVAMIAVPALMESRENYLLTSTARDVAAKLHQTRIRAITRNQDCRFRVSSPVTYVIECQTSAWLPDEFGGVPRGFSLAGNAAPRFHRRGNASPAATITIWNTRGRQRRVIVNIAGRVRVE